LALKNAVLAPVLPLAILSFLAAKWAGVDFEDFKEEMDDRDETEAFFAWRRAAEAPT
jgi:hypothetical protein